MNKVTYSIILFLLANIGAFAQSNVKDSTRNHDVKALVIVYDVTYPNKKQTFEAICYNKCIAIIYGSKMFNTCFTESGDTYTSISNDGGVNFLLLYPNQKLMINNCRDDKSPIGTASKTISTTNSMKNILGYECKETKMEIEVNFAGANTKTISYLYTYDQFKNYNLDYSCKGVNGIMLGIDVDMGSGCIQRQTAKSVSEQFVDSTMFDIPTDYTLLTMGEYTLKLMSDKSFRKKMNKEFKISPWKEFFKTLLEAAPEILTSVSNTTKTNYKTHNSIATLPSQANKQNTQNEHALDAYKAHNADMENKANKAVVEANKNSEYYFNYYTKEAEKERAEAERCLKEAKRYEELAEIGIKQGKDESLNLKYSKAEYSNYEMHKNYAEEAEKSAKIYKK